MRPGPACRWGRDVVLDFLDLEQGLGMAESAGRRYVGWTRLMPSRTPTLGRQPSSWAARSLS